MRKNLVALCALAALLVGTTHANAETSTGTQLGEIHFSFALPSADGTLDGFAGGLAPNQCSIVVPAGSHEALLSFFTGLKAESSAAKQLPDVPSLPRDDFSKPNVAKVTGLVANVCGEGQSMCSCGTCMEVDGNMACSASVNCCPQNMTCDAKCESDLANLTQTSEGSCKPKSGMDVPALPSPNVPNRRFSIQWGSFNGAALTAGASLA